VARSTSSSHLVSAIARLAYEQAPREWTELGELIAPYFNGSPEEAARSWLIASPPVRAALCFSIGWRAEEIRNGLLDFFGEALIRKTIAITVFEVNGAIVPLDRIFAPRFVLEDNTVESGFRTYRVEGVCFEADDRPTRTGRRGRPPFGTSLGMKLIVDEFLRRVSDGKGLDSQVPTPGSLVGKIGKDAETLRDWFAITHPNRQGWGLRTIENAIRDEHHKAFPPKRKRRAR
jgi:hypothetical protein